MKNKNHTAIKIITFLALLCSSCTTKSTKIKNPIFSTDTKTIKYYLDQTITCQNFNVNGKEINNNGKITSELDIDISKAQNIPTDGAEFKSKLKLIASIFKAGLKDKNEYDVYKVSFETITTKINLLGTFTNKNYKGCEFKTNELENGN